MSTSFLATSEVYKGTSTGGGYGLYGLTHRYLIEVTPTKVRYLQLDGPERRIGNVYQIQTKTWLAWCKEKAKMDPSWTEMIASAGSTPQGTPSVPGLISVRTMGKQPAVTFAHELVPGQTILYGRRRFLVIDLDPGAEDNDLALVDLDEFIMVRPNKDVPYFIAQSTLTLSL